MSVASVTVAYNDASVLARELDALLRHTKPVQEIIVADNASTDWRDSYVKPSAELVPQPAWFAGTA